MAFLLMADEGRGIAEVSVAAIDEAFVKLQLQATQDEVSSRRKEMVVRAYCTLMTCWFILLFWRVLWPQPSKEQWILENN